MTRVRSIILGGVSCLLALSGCDQETPGSSGDPASAEIDATSPVIADGAHDSDVTITIYDADGAALSGIEVEIVSEREDLDTIEQPSAPTDASGQTEGRVSSTTVGVAVLSVTADGTALDQTATVNFISPDAACDPGDQEDCYTGPAGTLGEGNCVGGTRTCTDEEVWGACEGEVVPAASDGCNPGDDDCDGVPDEDVDLTSVDSCGSCDNPCLYDNAEAFCDAVTSTCSMGDCLTGYFDLANGDTDGCEYPCDGDPADFELCDGLDNNCNGLFDEGFDFDQDGFTSCGTVPGGGLDAARVDCNDDAIAINPDAAEIWDCVDQNCDGVNDSDVPATTGCGSLGVCGGTDPTCNADGTFSCVYPTEYALNEGTAHCDGLDNDCDGLTDEACACADGASQPCSTDVGSCTVGTQDCVGSAWGACSGILPDVEVCDGEDNDCNDTTPDGDAEAWHGNPCDGADSDQCLEGTWFCDAGGVQACSDTSGDQLDLCDGVDNDCNPVTADGSDEAWFGDGCDGPDADLCEEGVLLCNAGLQACSDASDDNAELCDGADNDCDPSTVDGSDEPALGFPCDGPDSDQCEEGAWECVGGSPACSDTSADDLDLCDDVDNDCDPATADGVHETWIGVGCDGPDSDLCEEGVEACVAGLQECSDTSTDDLEVCDGADNDCDTLTDEPDAVDASTWYADTDGDLHGDPTVSQAACTRPAGYVADGTDCDDTNALIHPDMSEICDGLDNDCDVPPEADEGTVDSTWYRDTDGDGYGDDGDSQVACAQPTPGTWVLQGGDCDETRTDVNPGELEVCDGADNDCDGSTADGSGEPWFGNGCDGTDSDLCPEGTYGCVAGLQACDDTSGDTPDSCDGTNDDCDPSTPDGSGEAWFGSACDGPDGDLCLEGSFGCVSGSQSCNDTTGNLPDLCDGADNDCDPTTPDGAGEVQFGNPCDGGDSDLCPEGFWACDGTALFCDDTSGDTLDTCNGVNDDCDGSTADGAHEAWLGNPCDGPDADLCTEGTFVCSGGAQTCNDTTGDLAEVCDGFDNDCDPSTADGADAAWLGSPCDGTDADLCAEGVFVCVAGGQSCDDPNDLDLDLCDDVDNDCDASTVDGEHEGWFGGPCDGPDNDLCPEGAFECVASTQVCNDPTGDLFDTCDGTDNDCNPATVDGQAEAWLGTPCDGPDSDLCDEGSFACVAGSQSCDDATGDTLEVCGNGDEDCDGSTDEPDAVGAATWYADTDIDNYGDPLVTTTACTQPVGWVADNTDCNDANPNVNPAMTELCDGLDNDCDSPPEIDEGVTYSDWFYDNDGDNYGDPNDTINDCQQPAAGYVLAGGDCDDIDPFINPGRPDLCDTVNNDCNPGTADGSGEVWYGAACDGPDSDLCAEGTDSCVAGSQSCSDTSGDDLEICNGANDDCNVATADGSDEPWLGDPCDGLDSDLCEEGSYACSGGAQSCSDATGSTLDLCDGADNDCNPLTPDGADEAGFGNNCDGPDTDLCPEGTRQCDGSGPGLYCSDTTGDNPELCNGVDDDCNVGTPDGANDDCSDGDPCTVGTCSGGACNQGIGQDLADGFEWVEVSCDLADNDCDGCTDEGCGGDLIVAAEVVPFSNTPGLRRLSGNGQLGPIGALLPVPLIVQVNDGAGAPMPGEVVTFAVEPINSVCFGEGGSHNPANNVATFEIPRLCNNAVGTLVAPTTVRTDINGQARVELQLPAGTGMTVVSAEALGVPVGEPRTYFFAAAAAGFASTITVGADSNPVLGPLNGTQGSPPNPTNVNDYTLAITGLSATTGATNGVPSAGLVSGGVLTISGVNFGGGVVGNRKVWIGGVEATINSWGATSIQAVIPEGIAGAASVVVDDGSTTAFAVDWQSEPDPRTGNVPSRAGATASFWRVAPKPLYIYADGESSNGTQAKVRLLGLDACGNPVPISGASPTLWSEDPDASSPAAAVSVQNFCPDGSGCTEGVADVVHVSQLVKSAVIAGEVNLITTTGSATATVSTVPRTLAPDPFDGAGLGPADGVNSIILRGGDESDTTNADTFNPAMPLDGGTGNVDMVMDVLPLNTLCIVGDATYDCPGATPLSQTYGPVFAGEAHLGTGSATSDGRVTRLPNNAVNGARDSALAGTVILVTVGGYDPAVGEGGTIAVLAGNVGYYLGTVTGTEQGTIAVDATTVHGWLTQDFTPGSELQTIELGTNNMMEYAPGENRNLVLRIAADRTSW